ncbi:MAG: hypothetical protein WBV80_16345 [Mycobacterium sp.]
MTSVEADSSWRFCVRALGGNVGVRGIPTDQTEHVSPQRGGQP